MKWMVVSVSSFSILLSGFLVLIPHKLIADSRPDVRETAQTAGACCQGERGNVNEVDIIDQSDLSALVSYLTGGGYVLHCWEAANVNGVGSVDLCDLSALVSYLTGNSLALPECPSTVTDIDGNTYHIVTIGSQVWMAENLRVTHYRNGDPVPNVTDVDTWFGLTSGAYCACNNDDGNTITYGLLYNWFAVADSRNLAPAGWHVANDDEWTILTNDLGGNVAAGGKMKDVGTTHWQSPNTGATNVSGFSALPGGFGFDNHGWGKLGSYAFFWSTTPYIYNDAWCRVLGYDYSRVYRDIYDKNLGHSVRCVRD